MSLTSPSLIHVGQHGTSASGFVTIAWLEATPDDWPHVAQDWDATRAHVTHRHRIPVDTEILRSVQPESSVVKHRRQRALSNALHTISNQNIRIGSVYTRTTPRKPQNRARRTPHRTPPTNQHPPRRRQRVRDPFHHNRTASTTKIRPAPNHRNRHAPQKSPPALKWPTSSPGQRTNTSPITMNRTFAGTSTTTSGISTSTANRWRSRPKQIGWNRIWPSPTARDKQHLPD